MWFVVFLLRGSTAICDPTLRSRRERRRWLENSFHEGPSTASAEKKLMITAQSGQHFTKRGGCTSFSQGVVRLATLLSLTPTTSSSPRRQAPLKKPSQVKIEGSPELPLVHTYRWEIGWHTKSIVCLCNLSITSENGVPKTVLVIFDSITKKRHNTYSFQSVSIPRVTLFLIFKYFIFAKLIHTST